MTRTRHRHTIRQTRPPVVSIRRVLKIEAYPVLGDEVLILTTHIALAVFTRLLASFTISDVLGALVVLFGLFPGRKVLTPGQRPTLADAHATFAIKLCLGAGANIASQSAFVVIGARARLAAWKRLVTKPLEPVLGQTFAPVLVAFGGWNCARTNHRQTKKATESN